MNDDIRLFIDDHILVGETQKHAKHDQSTHGNWASGGKETIGEQKKRLDDMPGNQRIKFTDSSTGKTHRTTVANARTAYGSYSDGDKSPFTIEISKSSRSKKDVPIKELKYKRLDRKLMVDRYGFRDIKDNHLSKDPETRKYQHERAISSFEARLREGRIATETSQIMGSYQNRYYREQTPKSYGIGDIVVPKAGYFKGFPLMVYGFGGGGMFIEPMFDLPAGKVGYLMVEPFYSKDYPRSDGNVAGYYQFRLPVDEISGKGAK